MKYYIYSKAQETCMYSFIRLLHKQKSNYHPGHRMGHYWNPQKAGCLSLTPTLPFTCKYHSNSLLSFLCFSLACPEAWCSDRLFLPAPEFYINMITSCISFCLVLFLLHCCCWPCCLLSLLCIIPPCNIPSFTYPFGFCFGANTSTPKIFLAQIS